MTMKVPAPQTTLLSVPRFGVMLIVDLPVSSDTVAVASLSCINCGEVGHHTCDRTRDRQDYKDFVACGNFRYSPPLLI